MGWQILLEESRHLAVRRQVIDTANSLRQRHRRAELRVGEVDAALFVDDQVVGGVEPLALVLGREDPPLSAVGTVGGDLARVHFTRDDLALGVDHEAVRHVRLLAEDAQLAAASSFMIFSLGMSEKYMLPARSPQGPRRRRNRCAPFESGRPGRCRDRGSVRGLDGRKSDDRENGGVTEDSTNHCATSSVRWRAIATR